MDFSRAGAVQALSGAFRARVQWKQDGHLCEGPGPRRPQREAAEGDLESMRDAASGMSREEGFAAMEAEATRLREGRAPRDEGSVTPLDDCHRARIQWREGGAMCHVYGPRRAEKRRADLDLEAIINTWACQNPR